MSDVLRLSDGATVTAAVHRPSSVAGPAVLLTHGAGGDLDDGGLVALATGLSSAGHLVVRANLPYREAGRRARPPAAERSVPGFREIVAAAREFAPEQPWVVGGKSYGGRVASLAVAAGLPAVGLLFYGYPLHPPGKPDRLRTDHWPLIGAPTLFLQGTRDALCDVVLLERELPRLAAPPTLHLVEGGDHSLAVRAADTSDGRRRTPDETLLALVPGVVGPWLAGL